MKAITSVLFFFTLTLFSYAQAEKINQIDPAGKKDGKWIVYLNDNWKELKDSANAVYCRYTYYDHGANIYPMGPCGKKNYKLEFPRNTNGKSGAIKLLDGEYKWLNEKGQLSSVHNFKMGEYIFCKEYFPSGQLSQHFDYTKKWEEQPHTWCLSIYDEKGNLKLEYYMKKDKNGKWPVTR